MKRQHIAQGVLYLLLLATGIALRAWFEHAPNFAPVAAIALFAGFVFSSKLVAVSLPLAIMGISDQLIGGYDAPMMALVHGALTLPVLGGIWLQRRESTAASRSLTRYVARVFGTTLAASCAFFLVTNFGSWLWFDMYEPTLAGLVRCYTNALPFFRHTLEGDLLFSAGLFGAYAAYARLAVPSAEEVPGKLRPVRTRA